MTEQRRALVVGISEYDDLSQLLACEHDAVKMQNLLKECGYLVFDDNDSLIGKVSFVDLKKSIIKFFTEDSGPEDTLIFYFSGHGLIDGNGRHYLATSEISRDKPYSDGYPMEDILHIVKECKSRRIIIMLDCCYSGGILATEDMFRNSHERIFGQLPSFSRKVCILASSQLYQLSYLMDRENSLFTSFLLKGIKGDPDAIEIDGKVTPASLFNYVYNRVLSLPAAERNDQKPFCVTSYSELEKIIVEYRTMSRKIIDKHTIMTEIEKMMSEGRRDELSSLLNYITSYGMNYVHSGNYVKAKEYFSDKSLFSHVAVLYHNQGLTSLLLGNNKEAIKEFMHALEINPTYESAWNFRAICHAKLEQFNEALDCFDKSIEISPKDAGIRYNKGLCLLKMNQHERAAESFDSALSIQPNFIDALTNKGVCLSSLGKFEDAIKCYEQVLSYDKSAEFAWNNMALANININKKEALRCIGEAIRINPGLGYLFYTKGRVLESFGTERYLEALDAYEIAAKLDSANVDATYSQGLILAKLGDNQKAEEIFRQVTILREDDFNAWYNLGISLSKLDRSEEAMDCFNKSIELNDRYVYSWHAKGLSLEQLGRIEAAIDCYDKCLKIDLGFFDGWYSKGLALQKIGRDHEAIDCCNKAIEVNPNDTMIWLNKGNSLATLGQIGLALQCYQKSINLDPGNARAWANKGGIMLKRGQFEDAIDCYKKAIEIDPILIKAEVNTFYAHAWSNKGVILLNMGKNRESIESFERALEIDRSNSHAWQMKGIAHFKNHDYEQASDSFKRAMELDEGNHEIRHSYIQSLNNIGAKLGEQGNYLEAVKYVRKSIQMDETYYPAWYNLASFFRVMGENKEADNALAKARSLDPSLSHNIKS